MVTLLTAIVLTVSAPAAQRQEETPQQPKSTASAPAAEKAKPEETRKDRRDRRAGRRIVVNVEEEADRENGGESPGFGSRVARGAAKVWNGIVDFAGKMLNVDQDVPAPREEKTASEAEKNR